MLTAGGGDTYEFFKDGISLNTDPNIDTYTATTSGNYTVVVTNAAGCSATSAAVSVTVNPLPTAPTLATYGPYCASDAPVTLPSGGVWTGSGVSGPATDGTYTFTPSAVASTTATTTTLTYTVTNAAGCHNSASTDITVNPLPIVAANNLSTASVCVSNTIQLSNPTPPTLGFTGAWSVAPVGYATVSQTGLVSGVQATSSQMPVTVIYTITNTATGCSSSVSTTITVSNCTYYSYTQGFYGQTNGVTCVPSGSSQTAKKAPDVVLAWLQKADRSIGSGANQLQLLKTDATNQAICVVQKMPAGGTPGVLGYNQTACNAPIVKTTSKFNNTLLGQAIALSINMSNEPLLRTFLIGGSSINTNDIILVTKSIANSCTTVSNSNVESSFALPNRAAGLTVQQLYDMANAVLGGNAPTLIINGTLTVVSITAAQLTQALTAINNGFDKGREFVRFTQGGVPVTRGAVVITDPSPLQSLSSDALTAYPNPFTTATTLEFALTETTRYTLTVYDLKGSVVSRVSSGEAKAGARNSFSVGEGLQSGVYVARLVTEKATHTIRLNLVK